MRLKYIIYTIIGIALAGFAYYGISPLFRNVELNEQDPSLPPPPPQTQTEKQAMPEQRSVSDTNIQAQARPEQEPIVAETSPQEEARKKIKTAPVVGTAGHPASGEARIIEAEGRKYLRYENFKTINGPDLFVYLAKDMRASDFVNLGRLRATEGNINYEIPQDVNVKDYPYALVWCRAFSVLFNSVDIGSL